MLTSIKWLFFPFITGLCYANRNNVKLIFISSTINSLYVFSKIQIKYKQISNKIYPKITTYESLKNNLVVLINGNFIKLISDNSFYKKNNIYLAINDTFDCTTYTFIDITVEHNNKLYPILLKTKEYNFYISGNIIDKYFIQYLPNINSAILFPPLDDGSIPKEKSSFCVSELLIRITPYILFFGFSAKS